MTRKRADQRAASAQPPFAAAEGRGRAGGRSASRRWSRVDRSPPRSVAPPEGRILRGPPTRSSRWNRRWRICSLATRARSRIGGPWSPEPVPGIGRAIAIAFAAAGADVALVGRREQALVRDGGVGGEGGRSGARPPADVTDSRCPRPSGFESAVTSWAHASIAVANAGVDAWADLRGLDPDRLRRALATNTEGVANLARSVVPSMREHGGGKLIVVASDNGRRAEAGGSGSSRRSSRPSGSPSRCRSS